MTFGRIPPIVSNAIRLGTVPAARQTQVQRSGGIETNTRPLAPDGAPPLRSADTASGAMLVPRRPLSFITGGAAAGDGPAAAMALELRQHIQDAGAWRAAWKDLQYSSPEGWVDALAPLGKLESRVAEQLPPWQQIASAIAASKDSQYGSSQDWAGALAPLGQLEARVTEQLRAWGPEGAPPSGLPPEQRERLVAMQDLLWGLRDGQTLVAWASVRGPATPMQLAEHFGLDASAASASEVREGASPLTQQERMALSLYSVNAEVQMLREPALSRAFHVVNAALRHQQPEMQWAVQGLTAPLLSGMDRLPAVPDQTVLRGLWLPGPDALAVVQDRMKPGAQFNTSDVWTGSREAPYPGQVVFVIQPLPDATLTQARDTSAFSYATEQREAAFIPGARFEVKDVQRFDPGLKGGAGIDLSGAQTASSGRSWEALEAQPLLKVTLQEVPPSAAGK
jgi:hypothetical protein